MADASASVPLGASTTDSGVSRCMRGVSRSLHLHVGHRILEVLESK